MVMLKLPNGLVTPLIALADLPAALHIRGLQKSYNHQPYGTILVEVLPMPDIPDSPYKIEINHQASMTERQSEATMDDKPIILSDFAITNFQVTHNDPVHGKTSLTSNSSSSSTGLAHSCQHSDRENRTPTHSPRRSLGETAPRSPRSTMSTEEGEVGGSNDMAVQLYHGNPLLVRDDGTWRPNDAGSQFQSRSRQPSFAVSRAPSIFSEQSFAPSARAPHQGHPYNAGPPHRGGRPKEYCIKWMQDGQCSYTGHGGGCTLKHIMPMDPEKLDELGFSQTPDWWIIERNWLESIGVLQALRDLPEPIKGWDGVGPPRAWFQKEAIARYDRGGYRSNPSFRFGWTKAIPRVINPESDIWPNGAQRLAYERGQIDHVQLFNTAINLNNPGSQMTQCGVGPGAGGGSMRHPSLGIARPSGNQMTNNGVSPFLGPLSGVGHLGVSRTAASPAPSVHSNATLPQWQHLTRGSPAMGPLASPSSSMRTPSISQVIHSPEQINYHRMFNSHGSTARSDIRAGPVGSTRPGERDPAHDPMRTPPSGPLASSIWSGGLTRQTQPTSSQSRPPVAQWKLPHRPGRQQASAAAAEELANSRGQTSHGHSLPANQAADTASVHSEGISSLDLTPDSPDRAYPISETLQQAMRESTNDMNLDGMDERHLDQADTRLASRKLTVGPPTFRTIAAALGVPRQSPMSSFSHLRLYGSKELGGTNLGLSDNTNPTSNHGSGTDRTWVLGRW